MTTGIINSYAQVNERKYGQIMENYFDIYVTVKKNVGIPDGYGGKIETFEIVYSNLFCCISPVSESLLKLLQGDSRIASHRMYVVGTILEIFVNDNVPLRDIQPNYRVFEHDSDREYRVLEVNDHSEGKFLAVDMELIQSS